MKRIDGKDIYTVTEVNYLTKQTLEQMIFWVEGEISTCRKNPSWNFYYLDLKDEKALLPCLAEGHMLEILGENPVGQKILAFGNLSLYEPLGKYQFRISRVEKFGEGLLQKQLEDLIKKLKAEGLFDRKYKKEIPVYPKRICLVTSVGSDAYHDFKKHTIDKFPIIQLYTADVRVQGPQSIPSLLKIIPQVDREGYDVVVITRGGGSLEDLAAFSDEQVARAIFAMETPTIVAIGHEANESLAEWVADRRASTPTDAANILTAGYQNLLASLTNLKFRLTSKADFYFSTNFQKLDYLYYQLTQTKRTFADLPHRLQTIAEHLRGARRTLINDSGIKLDALANSLSILSPQNTLERGYAIAADERGQILRSVKNVEVGHIIGVRLTDGSLKSKVTQKTP